MLDLTTYEKRAIIANKIVDKVKDKKLNNMYVQNNISWYDTIIIIEALAKILDEDTSSRLEDYIK